MPEERYTTLEELKALLRREALRPASPRAEARQSHLTLRQLEVFREATRHSTFTETAQTLGISKEAVGATVHDIEKNIGDGVRLFERGSGQSRTSLTSAGKALAEKADRLLSDEADLRSALGRGGSGDEDQVPDTPARAHHVTLRQIEIFLEAARNDSFSDASKTLGITSTAIGQTISDLERSLGDVQLFDRNRSGARLTHAGKVLLQRAPQLLRDETEARNVLASRKDETEGESPVRPNHRYNAESILAAVQFIEQHASAGREIRFPAALTDGLESALAELGHSGETVDRVAFILDVMQVSVTDPKDLGAILEPKGQASQTFRDLHEASEQRHASETKDAGRSRAKRSR
jgi:DNA-binding transcriptional LysR family regulator